TLGTPNKNPGIPSKISLRKKVFCSLVIGFLGKTKHFFDYGCFMFVVLNVSVTGIGKSRLNSQSHQDLSIFTGFKRSKYIFLKRFFIFNPVIAGGYQYQGIRIALVYF